MNSAVVRTEGRGLEFDGGTEGWGKGAEVDSNLLDPLGLVDMSTVL